MNTDISDATEEEVRQAVIARRRRIEIGRETGALRHRGLDPLQRRMATAKATFEWMRRTSVQKAVRRLEEVFGSDQAALMLDEWGEKGAKVFLQTA